MPYNKIEKELNEGLHYNDVEAIVKILIKKNRSVSISKLPYRQKGEIDRSCWKFSTCDNIPVHMHFTILNDTFADELNEISNVLSVRRDLEKGPCKLSYLMETSDGFYSIETIVKDWSDFYRVEEAYSEYDKYFR